MKFTYVEDRLEHLGDWIVEEKILQKVGILILIGIACNFYNMAQFALSIDDETSALRVSPDIWVAQGRWGMYLIEKFLMPQPVVPFMPELLLVIASSIFYVLVFTCLKIKIDWRAYLSFPVFLLSPVFIHIGSFYGNITGISLGLVLVALACFLFFYESHGHAQNFGAKVIGLLISSILLGTAIGIYQSFLLLYPCIVLSACILRRDWVEKRAILKVFLLVLLPSVAGLIFYYVVKILFKSYGFLEQPAFWARYDLLPRLIEKPFTVLFDTLGDVLSFYLGAQTIFALSMLFQPLVLLLGVSVLLTSSEHRLKLLLILSLILLLPFVMNLVAGPLPPRALLSFAFSIWLLSFLGLSAKNISVRVLAIIFCVGLNLQYLYLSSVQSATATLALEEDKRLAQDIYNRMTELIPDEMKEPYKVVYLDVYGQRSVITPYSKYGKAMGSTIGASFFQWDSGNIWRMASFMKLLGYHTVQPLDNDRRESIIDRYQKMPVWPQPGSVIREQDIFLVKLSDTADPLHLVN
jgi:hypothetical protein